MGKLHELIGECSGSSLTVIATIVSGASMGEQLLLEDSKVVYCSDDGVFDSALKRQIAALTETRMLETEAGKIFCERIGGEKKLVICGAGHVSIPIIRIGKMVGFHVTVLEDRPKFADNARREHADRVICESFETALDRVEGDADTYFVIVTRGHRYDQECLARIVGKESAYVGMIGSKLRIKTVKEILTEQGISQELLQNIYAPIGLDIKAETPEEIAVAIMAEIIEVKNKVKRSAGFGKEILQQISENMKDSVASVLATMISRRGSAPREVGTKMLICRDGKTVGTIGGGCVEAELIQKALAMTKEDSRTSCVCSVDMTGREAEDEGMVCGGIIEVLLERVS